MCGWVCVNVSMHVHVSVYRGSGVCECVCVHYIPSMTHTLTISDCGRGPPPSDDCC